MINDDGIQNNVPQGIPVLFLLTKTIKNPFQKLKQSWNKILY